MSGSNWDFSRFVDPPPGGKAAPEGSDVPGTSADSNRDAFVGSLPSEVPPSGSFTFSGSTSSSTGVVLETGHPPVLLLAASALVVVVGGLLAALFGEVPTAAVVAWVLSGPLAIGLLAAFTSFDTRQRARAIYSNPSWARPAYATCLVLCGVAVCASAVRIAFWVGRL